MNIVVVMGTRPGIVKMSPVYRALKELGLPAKLLYTGQHYSSSLKEEILKPFALPDFDYTVSNIEESNGHCDQISRMLKGCGDGFEELAASHVVVCGDANTNLAAGLAARKMNLHLSHVESGLRSNDFRMPEEHNRRILDHISNLLFAPTQQCFDILKRENVFGCPINVGNTVVDATLWMRDYVKTLTKSNIKNDEKYIVFTIHRQENVDDPSLLRNLLVAIDKLSKFIRVVFPIHPRTERRIKEFGISLPQSSMIDIVAPLPYVDMQILLNNASLIATDSGGLQEESYILGKPCVTLRDNTERPESLSVGANVLAGTSTEKVVAAVKEQLEKKIDFTLPIFGDGNASTRIAHAIRESE